MIPRQLVHSLRAPLSRRVARGECEWLQRRAISSASLRIIRIREEGTVLERAVRGITPRTPPVPRVDATMWDAAG
jgi:hypothetical protein